jgi:predicted anti-sigma-YlaC factor YlaD
MNCHKARKCLPDTIDGSLTPRLRVPIASHLAACAECREELRRLETTRRLLSTYGAIPAPVDFGSLAARLAVRRRGSELFLRVGRGLVVTTAAVALAAVTWQWQRPAHEPPGSPPPRFAVREVAEVQELHQAFAVQQSLAARDGLLLFAPQWVDGGR